MDPSNNIQQPNNAPLPSNDLFMSPNIPQPSVPDKPKGKKKFVIFGALLIVVLIIVVLAAVLVKKPKSSSSSQASQETVTLANNLMKNVGDEKYIDAYKSITFTEPPSRQRSVNIVSEMNHLEMYYPVRNCVQTSSTQELITYVCKNEIQQITVDVSVSNNPAKITNFQLGKVSDL